jgi:hypothetical protein
MSDSRSKGIVYPSASCSRRPLGRYIRVEDGEQADYGGQDDAVTQGEAEQPCLMNCGISRLRSSGDSGCGVAALGGFLITCLGTRDKLEILVDTHYSYSGKATNRIPLFTSIVLHNARIFDPGKITLDGYDREHLTCTSEIHFRS